MRKVGLVAVLAAAAIAGSALGGGLLSAGAATNSTTPTAPSNSQTAPQNSSPPGPRHRCHHGQGQDAPSQQGSQSDSSLGSPAES
jgi:hypothetical protein